MPEETSRKQRTVLTKETVKNIRRSFQKELTLKNIAVECDVSISCARTTCTKIQMGLSDEDIVSVKKGRKSAPNEDLKSEIRILVNRDPSHTLNSIRNDLIARNIRAAPPTIAKYLKVMDFTRKRLNLVPFARNSTGNIDVRQTYCRNINSFPDTNLVFLMRLVLVSIPKNNMDILLKIPKLI
jgi:hypothetical protein